MHVAVANVALAGLGTAATLANRDDTSSPAATTSAELANISHACMAWMNDDMRWGPTSTSWCQHMTGWIARQMTNGSMTDSMIWRNPDRMPSTSQAWMEANPSSDRSTEWCD
jgi:hypothetical protein